MSIFLNEAGSSFLDRAGLESALVPTQVQVVGLDFASIAVRKPPGLEPYTRALTIAFTHPPLPPAVCGVWPI